MFGALGSSEQQCVGFAYNGRSTACHRSARSLDRPV